uniref:CAB/ELIP/HLIP superfamily protein n=1 Tax=Caulacanthus okamurae TaxID=152008 RepID=A0A6H1U6U3_9FLOR|nr:CAB/ELIP/HLIP superfamily protein [Caulacanthus okamurae]QIZ74602.1 CAB/ELIP/HLIP superfamily protein [Caulacanthus okamurae]
MFISFLLPILSNRWIWGFSKGAETWNGRLAMLSFLVIFYFEFVYSLPVLNLLGFL